MIALLDGFALLSSPPLPAGLLVLLVLLVLLELVDGLAAADVVEPAGVAALLADALVPAGAGAELEL